MSETNQSGIMNHFGANSSADAVASSAINRPHTDNPHHSWLCALQFNMGYMAVLGLLLVSTLLIVSDARRVLRVSSGWCEQHTHLLFGNRIEFLKYQRKLVLLESNALLAESFKLYFTTQTSTHAFVSSITPWPWILYSWFYVFQVFLYHFHANSIL